MSKQVCNKKIKKGQKGENIIHVYYEMIYKKKHLIPIIIPHSDC